MLKKQIGKRFSGKCKVYLEKFSDADPSIYGQVIFKANAKKDIYSVDTFFATKCYKNEKTRKGFKTIFLQTHYRRLEGSFEDMEEILKDYEICCSDIWIQE